MGCPLLPKAGARTPSSRASLCTVRHVYIYCTWSAYKYTSTLKANSYFDGWRMTYNGPQSRNNETVTFISYSDRWRMTVDAQNPNRAILYCFERVRPNTSGYDNVQYSICLIHNIRQFPSSVLIRVLTHTNSELNEPWVNRQPSCVNRQSMNWP